MNLFLILYAIDWANQGTILSMSESVYPASRPVRKIP